MSFFNNLSRIFSDQADKSAKKPVVKAGKPGQKAQKAKSAKAQVGGRDDRRGKSGKVVAQKGQRPARQQPVRQQFQQPARQPQPDINADALAREAKAKAREIIVEAKDEALAIRTEAEKKARKLEVQADKQQRFLENKLDKLDDRLEQLDRRDQDLNKSQKKFETINKKTEQDREKILKKLERVSKMTVEEAKKNLMEGLERKMTTEMAQYIKQREDQAKEEADEKGQEIIIEAMKYGATEHVAEYTVSVVTLPSEDIKGKIIGKNGRNIHTFERKTGVDVDLDVSPTEVKISSFDPVRREIARVSLQRLIKDGRIQPARIEEVVDKVQTEIEKIIFEAGKKLCHAVGVYNLPTGLIKLLGRFKYRFSYGQNMVTHTIEETKIGTKIAHELGLDVNIVKLGCLLHDIGKVDPDQDDNHIALGVKLAKQFGMPQPVVDCIAQHHEDEPFSGAEQMAVYIADAISGARPGARYENHEEYVKRLQDLEAIATSYAEVESAYAVQAGRELRILLRPEKSKDDDVIVLAGKIRDEVQEKVMVPGSVKVTVIRETRAMESTK